MSRQKFNHDRLELVINIVYITGFVVVFGVTVSNIINVHF